MPGLKTIFSKDGTPITDIKASVIRSSLLGDIGEAVFFVDTSSVKCRREVLENGNILFIEHDSLPNWVGVIDTPRTWHHGYVEVHAFEMPYILQYRTTPLNGSITGTPGEKFVELLAIANSQEDTLIRAGNVFVGGVSFPEIVSDSVYSHIKSVKDASGNDWICTPNIDIQGKLTIVMDWFEKAGVTTDLELAQGYNILYGDTPLEESGEIVNSVLALSDAEKDLNVIYTDEDSRRTTGLRQIRMSFAGILDSDNLRAAAKQYVDENKYPKIATPLTVVNVGSSFSNIRNGNIAKYKYSDVGFDGDGLGQSQLIRIDGWRFDESLGTCEIFNRKVV